MTTRIIVSILKTILTWMVESYNPYANVALFLLSMQQSTLDLKRAMKVAGCTINTAIRQLVQFIPGPASEMTGNRQSLDR